MASDGEVDGFTVVARALHAAGVRYMFGVVGIPVTQLAPACQAAGIRFISTRNEQAASYAAAAAGFLTGVPGALLTVSGPGMLHGVAGLANATANAWPMIQLSGSAPTQNVGKGCFQELDQVALAGSTQVAKMSAQPRSLREVPAMMAKAVETALAGRPGGVYIDLPSDLLRMRVAAAEVASAAVAAPPRVPAADKAAVAAVAGMLRSAKRPLLILGKGSAYGRAEEELRRLVDEKGIPFVATPMAKGVVPDAHPLSAAAARSLALKGADVAVVFGARLNWMLHFGEEPRWAADVSFVLVDPGAAESEEGDRRMVLRADAKEVAADLVSALGDWRVDAESEWVRSLQEKAAANTAKSAQRMAKPPPSPLDFTAAYAVIIQEAGRLQPHPVYVSEGANTMDIGRQLVPVNEPRCRLDAGTWGTMGVGLGYGIAASVVSPDRKVIALEGDSAFGFSGMELETLCRYKLNVCVIVFNNGGIYSGRTDKDPASQFTQDPVPTCFVPGIRYDQMMESFGGRGYNVASAAELRGACTAAFHTPGPSLINLCIDPLAGVESGSMQAHN